jgi:DegV family protein with EDD domain
MEIAKVTTVNGKNLYYLFLAGAQNIISHQGDLNKINVFPVPDADTGTNLASTIRSIIGNTKPNDSYKLTADALASAALLGARGNSGVIFAQFLYGLSTETENVQEITIDRFADSVRKSVAYVYDSVANPKEGTMLTVIREWADYIWINHNSTEDFTSLMVKSLEVAQKSLFETTAKLSALLKAHVVDAGAKGFVLFLEGIIEFITTGNLRNLFGIKNESVDVRFSDADIDHDSFTYRFCTEALIRGENIDKVALRSIGQEYGDSMVVAGSKNIMRFHIHTDRPQELLEKLRDYGTLTFQKADDMQKQYDIGHHRKWPIAIVTDSSCDLSQELIDRYQIHMVPMNIFFGDNHYLDKVTIYPEQFYRLLDLEEKYPTSAQPNDKTFENLYSHLASHYDSIIALHLSQPLSGTFNNSLKSAERIHEEFNKKISVIDTKNISGGLGLLVLKAAQLLEAGKSHEEIVTDVQNSVGKTKLYAAVKTLKYLVRGGRVSPVKGAIARVLNLTPIISVDEEGKAIQLEKVFSHEAGMQKVLQKIKKLAEGNKVWNYIIMHAYSEKKAIWFAGEVEKITNMKPVAILNISPVIGVHAGPGTIALAIMVD